MGKMKALSKLAMKANRVKFGLKKHSPEICMVLGITGVVVSAVSACVATYKLDEVIDDAKSKIDDIHETNDITEDTEVPKEVKKELSVVYAQTTFKVIKMYAPYIVIGTLSIGSILTSNRILRERYTATAAAYTVVRNSYNKYRAHVIERFGEDVDFELRHGIKKEEIVETVVDDNGKEKTITKTVCSTDDDEYSEFARIWYQGDQGYTDDPVFNMKYLKLMQAQANDRLKAQGYLFLNEVYEMLGFPKTKAGQIVGWTYIKGGNNPNGDNKVSFYLYDNIHSRAKRDFINGKEPGVLLDFNVDGNILDLIPFYDMQNRI